MSSKGLAMIKAGDFNSMNQDWQNDTDVLVTLDKRGDPVIYELLIRNLYRPGEEVLEEREIPRGRHTEGS